MAALFGREPEDLAPERTLHPTCSPSVIRHYREHGYVVTEEDGLGADIAGIVERNRHETSAEISLLIMNRLRGRK